MWQGKLGKIDDHLGDCQFEEVKCTNECEMIQRRYLTVHIETECPRREVTCRYCRDTGEHQHIEGRSVQDFLYLVPTSVRLKCLVKIWRSTEGSVNWNL